MKKTFLLIAALAATALTSCQEDIKGSIRDLGQNEMGFTVSNSSAATKAAGMLMESASIVLPGSANLCLSETVTSIDGLYEDSPATKGTPAYTENIGSLYGSFKAVGYQDGEVYLPEADFGFDSSDRLWKHTYSDRTEIDWAKGVYYFMQMPVSTACSNVTRNTENGRIEFDYTLPETAADQKDILFASKYITKKTDNKVHFHHALTAVKFAVGNSATDDVTITKVEFAGLKTKGHCTIIPNESEEFCDKCSSWTYIDESPARVISQTFDGTVTDYTKDNSSFADSFYAAGAENNMNDAAASKTFFLIPQTTRNVFMAITYTWKGSEYMSVVDLGESLKKKDGSYVSWNGGELRTYTLTFHELQVDVTDTMADGTKQNVVITNTSAKISEYVRAMVVANWVDADGNIVAPHTVQGITLKANWVKESDGFYYHTVPVQAGVELTSPFFETYTQPAGGPSGARLVMDIAVQAIDASAGSSYKEAWNKAAGTTL